MSKQFEPLVEKEVQRQVYQLVLRWVNALPIGKTQSTPEVAASAISWTIFAQRFKELLGDTPVNYVTKVRIQKSMELLVRTEESIERIAETVGYGTGFALSKAFKRIAGVSPQHYRLQATG